VLEDPGQAEFERFVGRYSGELGRLAYLMVGDQDAADDLTADALLAAWRQWDTVRSTDHPMAYVRRIVINLAASRVRRMVRERRRFLLLRTEALEVVPAADATAVVDVRSALIRLPTGRRACVVLRYAFDLSESDVAALLGISVGTVKSQTAKGAEQLRRALGPEALGSGALGSGALGSGALGSRALGSRALGQKARGSGAGIGGALRQPVTRRRADGPQNGREDR
jgi:RNA polymerase sigma-70 factor (sigma-E family)